MSHDIHECPLGNEEESILLSGGGVRSALRSLHLLGTGTLRGREGCFQYSILGGWEGA